MKQKSWLSSSQKWWLAKHPSKPLLPFR